MKKDLQSPRDASTGQTGSADKADLREDPSNTRTGNRPVPPSVGDTDEPKDHEYPKNERRWPENKVPTK